MAKLSLVFVLVLLSFGSFSQSYGLVKRGPYQIAKLSSPGADMHTLTYLDASYQRIDIYNTIIFDATNETMDVIYNTFKEQLSVEKNTEKTISLSDNTIKLVTKKALGNSYLEVWMVHRGRAGYFSLNEKEIDKLFKK